jgi:hypothetical protein
MTEKRGQPKRGYQNRTAKKDSQNSTGRTGLTEIDRPNKTGRTERQKLEMQTGKVDLDRLGEMGQP